MGEYDENVENYVGPSFGDSEEDSIYDYYESDPVDEKAWLDLFSDVVVEDEDKRYHVDPATGYEYAEDRKPHHWIEQDDGSWVCKICGETKQKTRKDRKKNDKTDDVYLEEVVQRVKKWKEEHGEVIPQQSQPLSASQEAVDEIWSKTINKMVTDEDLSNADAVARPSYEIRTGDLEDETDKCLELADKFAVGVNDKGSTGIIEEIYHHPVLCEYKDKNGEECKQLAQYINGDGKKYCYKHIQPVYCRKMKNGRACKALATSMVDGVSYCEEHAPDSGDVEMIDNIDPYEVKKIAYPSYGEYKMIGDTAVIDESELNDLDEFILSKQGGDVLPIRLIKGIERCQYEGCVSKATGLPEIASYEFVLFHEKRHQFLCEKHSLEMIKNKFDRVKKVYKLEIPSVEKGQFLRSELMFTQGDGSRLMNTIDILEQKRRRDRERHEEGGTEYLLYLCPDKVAERRGRYKIFDPMGGEIEGAEDALYFRLPAINEELSSPGKIVLHFSSDYIDHNKAKEVYRDFLNGVLDEHDLAMSVRARAKSDAEDYDRKHGNKWVAGENQYFSDDYNEETKRKISQRDVYKTWRKYIVG